jgi:hypothetical protein
MAVPADIFLRLRYLLFIPLFLLNGKATFSQTAYYIPKALLIPVHTHKQELHVSLGLGGGYDANISYALAKHVAVFATGTLQTGTHSRRSFWGDRYYIHKNDHAVTGGIGYFLATNHKWINNIESYAGYGRYKVGNYWYFPEYRESGIETKAGYWNVFWQLQAIYKGERQEAAFALHLAYNRYYHLQYRDVSNYAHVKTTQEGVWGLTVGPVIGYSYLLKKMKFNVQAGGSVSVNPKVPVAEMYYWKEGGQILSRKSSGTTKAVLAGFIGRLSVQYHLDFRRK